MFGLHLYEFVCTKEGILLCCIQFSDTQKSFRKHLVKIPF